MQTHRYFIFLLCAVTIIGKLLSPPHLVGQDDIDYGDIGIDMGQPLSALFDEQNKAQNSNLDGNSLLGDGYNWNDPFDSGTGYDSNYDSKLWGNSTGKYGTGASSLEERRGDDSTILQKNGSAGSGIADSQIDQGYDKEEFENSFERYEGDTFAQDDFLNQLADDQINSADFGSQGWNKEGSNIAQTDDFSQTLPQQQGFRQGIPIVDPFTGEINSTSMARLYGQSENNDSNLFSPFGQVMLLLVILFLVSLLLLQESSRKTQTVMPFPKQKEILPKPKILGLPKKRRTRRKPPAIGRPVAATSSTKIRLSRYYRILGATPDDSDESIKRKYRELVKEYHTDRLTSSSPTDTTIERAYEKFNVIQEAYRAVRIDRGF